MSKSLRTALVIAGLLTLIVARTTRIGPTVLVLSSHFGLGVHSGDLLALALTSSVAIAVAQVREVSRVHARSEATG